MNKDNKNTELDNTDKKLHISDVMCSLLCLIGILMKISKKGETDLLEKMYKNGDIDNSVYRKYL